MSKVIPARYHPLQVSFHWLVVVLLFAAFILGKYMSGLPNDAAKIVPIGVHMILGFVTLFVIIARFIARLRLWRIGGSPTSRFLRLYIAHDAWVYCASVIVIGCLTRRSSFVSPISAQG